MDLDDGVKSFLYSKTVWGGVIAVAAGALGFFGWSVSTDDQQAMIDLAVAAAGAVGGLVAIYGRVRASKKIG